MEDVIYETKFRNPNNKGKSVPLLIFGVVAMIASPLIGGLGGAVVGLLIMFGAIFASIAEDRTKDASLTIFKNENRYRLTLKGEDLEHSIEGELTYEGWRKLTQSKNGSYTYNTPSISIRNDIDPEVLFQATGYNVNNDKKWGVIKDATSNHIGIYIKMGLDEINTLLENLEEIGLPLKVQ